MALTLVGLAVVLAAAWWITWPLLSPAGGDAFGSVDAGPGLIVERSEVERERDNALAAIREAEFDHRLGKLTDDDYARLRRDQEERALAALASIERSAVGDPGIAASAGRKAVDVRKSGSTGGAAFCTACGKPARGARFCPACGTKLRAPARG